MVEYGNMLENSAIRIDVIRCDESKRVTRHLDDVTMPLCRMSRHVSTKPPSEKRSASAKQPQLFSETEKVPSQGRIKEIR
eukprot:scaffold8747_cov96-Cylindrotheca_fusiformis.AAC.5